MKTNPGLAPDAAVDAAAPDLSGFARRCLPAYFTRPFSPLHRYLFRRHARKTASLLDVRKGAIDVVLAPRGAAKSTLVSLLFPLHGLLSGREPYIVLISATLRQATQRLANLRGVLRATDLWRGEFPEAAEQPLITRAEALQLGDCRIEAFSAGTELRGISHGAHRPSWIILDDIERSDRIISATYRERLHEWFCEVVENLGTGGTHIDLIGTLLHPDALPARLGKRPDVTVRTFRSIIREADDEVLWDQWRELLRNLDDPQRGRHAYRFYRANRNAMLAGARVLWPEHESYYALQKMRFVRGRAAFNKEKQNAPESGENALFEVGKLRRFKHVETAEGPQLQLCAAEGLAWPGEAPPPLRPINELAIYGFLDPALGDVRGDDAAIVTVGVDRQGYCFVLDAWLGKATPNEQITKIFEMHERWQYCLFGIEVVAFQKMLLPAIESERVRRRGMGLPWKLPADGITPRGAKQSRISMLEPLASNGWLMFAHDLPERFLDQLSQFPHGRHDDGPDALAGAVQLSERGVQGNLTNRNLIERRGQLPVF